MSSCPWCRMIMPGWYITNIFLPFLYLHSSHEWGWKPCVFNLSLCTCTCVRLEALFDQFAVDCCSFTWIQSMLNHMWLACISSAESYSSFPNDGRQCWTVIIVVWPSVSGIADLSKRRHVTITIIKCWTVTWRSTFKNVDGATFLNVARQVTVYMQINI